MGKMNNKLQIIQILLIKNITMYKHPFINKIESNGKKE